MKTGVWQFTAAVSASLLATVATAQQTAVIDFESVGRAWPLIARITEGQEGRGFGGGGSLRRGGGGRRRRRGGRSGDLSCVARGSGREEGLRHRWKLQG